MFESKLFVFSPNNFQREVFEYPFQDMWTNFISPVYPYSIKYTENWLKSILWEFNISYKESDDVEKIKKDYFEKVNYVNDKWYTIWIFLLWKQEIKKFFDTSYMNNIDIVSFLDEMWFKIKFFVFDNFELFDSNRDDSYKISDGNHEDIKKLINSKINIWEKHELTFFSNESDFNNLINNSELDLIYSDIYFDSRIYNLWINQFNLKYFYAWFSWALKTIKWLINLCEMGFYKKYSKYFNN